jgi:hypothetical protein
MKTNKFKEVPMKKQLTIFLMLLAMRKNISKA